MPIATPHASGVASTPTRRYSQFMTQDVPKNHDPDLPAKAARRKTNAAGLNWGARVRRVAHKPRKLGHWKQAANQAGLVTIRPSARSENASDCRTTYAGKLKMAGHARVGKYRCAQLFTPPSAGQITRADAIYQIDRGCRESGTTTTSIRFAGRQRCAKKQDAAVTAPVIRARRMDGIRTAGCATTAKSFCMC